MIYPVSEWDLRKKKRNNVFKSSACAREVRSRIDLGAEITVKV